MPYGRMAALWIVSKRILTISGLTALLWLAAIIALPALGSPYADQARAQTEQTNVQIDQP